MCHHLIGFVEFSCFCAAQVPVEHSAFPVNLVRWVFMFIDAIVGMRKPKVSRCTDMSPHLRLWSDCCHGELDVDERSDGERVRTVWSRRNT